MKFGCQLPQADPNIKHIFEVAEECENLGYDSIWVYDHLAPYWLRPSGSLEGWTLLSAVAERTSRIKIGSLVTNVNLRNPALLAKMTSTVDNISRGRLIVGLGIGDGMSVKELRSYGYRFPQLQERLTLLRETITVLKALWTGTEVSFKGRTAALSKAVCLPKPMQEPNPHIWVGGKHHGIIDVAAELADGWNCWGLSKPELLERERYLLAKCENLQRDPGSITRSWAGTMSSTGTDSSNLVESMKSQLASRTTGGTDYVVASFPPEADRKAYQSFAEAVKTLS